jgi:hypothetical protein
MEEVAYIGGKYKPLNKNKINDIILNGESLIKNKVVDLTSTIEDIKSSIDNDVFVIVDTLPTENIKSKIYCVLDSTGGGTDNKYIEWVYTNGAWEKVGEFVAEPDLSDYATKTLVNTTKTELTNSINTVNTNLTSNLDTKVSKAGDTMTGKLSVPYIETGTASANYFQCQKFRGEGDASSYYHAIDFGYYNHNQVDFYEYGATWNFWKGTTTADRAVKVGAITSTGWNGSAALTGTPTAPTAASNTNST